jgi:hypothetical protein
MGKKRAMKLIKGAVYGPNGARRDQLPNLDAEREVPSPDCLHEEEILLASLINEFFWLAMR